MKNCFIDGNEKIQVLKFNKLQEFKEKVELVYTLKTFQNGLKKEDSLNIRKAKLNELAKYLKINNLNIILSKQTHSDNIESIYNMPSHNLIDVDGLITNVKNIPLATTSADCTPIFFYDPIQNVIANIHSGWVGTTKRIGQKAVKILIDKYNCKAKNILCFIGPCIRKEHFLVNADVKEIFEETFKEFIYKYDIICNTNQFNEKGLQYTIDTTLINKILLKNIGILDENIYDSELCTMCNSNEFHSRRAEGIEYELNTAIMFLK